MTLAQHLARFYRNPGIQYNAKNNVLLFSLCCLLLFLGNGSGNYAAQSKENTADSQPGHGLDEGGTGTFQRMIVENGSVTMHLDLNRLNGINSAGGNTVHNSISPLRPTLSSLFWFSTIQLRDQEPGSIALMLPVDRCVRSTPRATVYRMLLASSLTQLVIEKPAPDAPFDFAGARRQERDSRFLRSKDTSTITTRTRSCLSITGGRLVVSKEFAESLGRPSDAGQRLAKFPSAQPCNRSRSPMLDENGDVKSATLPALNQPGVGTVPGPDVIVGDLIGLEQSRQWFRGGRVGLALGTDACNKGTIDVDWFALPSNDHPLFRRMFTE